MPQMASRVASFGTTIFTEINTLARAHNAVNLGQGAPDFDGPPEVVAAAVAALKSARNQYAPLTGIPEVKQAISAHAKRFYGQSIDPVSQVAITSGATEAMFAAILGLSDPGDEIIVFQPVYDSYVPNMTMCGVVPRYVTLREPGWMFDPDELRTAFNAKTRAIIINTPHNPTGKVFSREELTFIAELCQEHDVVALCDEVYEHILYDGAVHIRTATLPGMAERTLTISSLGKTFSVTGWKIGWAIGPEALVTGVLRSHQFITFAVSTPLQAAAATALTLPEAYFATVHETFQHKRDFLLDVLQDAGFAVQKPQGGYFIMADWRPLAPDGVRDDAGFARWLIQQIGVACIPPSFFYREQDRGLARHLARFAICKKDETLQAAAQKLRMHLTQGVGK